MQDFLSLWLAEFWSRSQLNCKDLRWIIRFGYHAEDFLPSAQTHGLDENCFMGIALLLREFSCQMVLLNLARAPLFFGKIFKNFLGSLSEENWLNKSYGADSLLGDMRGTLQLCDELPMLLKQEQVTSVLTAVVQGMTLMGDSSAVRLAATRALYNALDFAQTNFANAMDRNYVMKVVCETSVSKEPEIRQAAFECLVSISSTYYEMLVSYMQTLLELTGIAVKGDGEPIALQAIEFWSSICDEEIELQNSNIGDSNGPSIINTEKLPMIVGVLLESIKDVPNVADKVCGAIYFLAQGFEEAGAAYASLLTPYLHKIIASLISTAEETDGNDDRLRTSAYETLNEVIRCSNISDTSHIIAQLLPVTMTKLAPTMDLQIVSSDDRDMQGSLQASLCGVLQVIIQQVSAFDEIKGIILQAADQMMVLFLQVFACRSSTVHEESMLAIGALAYATGAGFVKYMNEFYNYLELGLQNFEEYQVCSISVGVVGDICCALDAKVLPFCDGLLCGCLQIFIQKLDKQLSDARTDFLVDARVFKGVSKNLCSQLMAVSSGRFDATFFGTIAVIHSPILYDIISIVTVAHQQLISGSSYKNGDGEPSTLMKARGKSFGLSLTAAVNAHAYSPEVLDHNIATFSSNIKRIGFIGLEAMGCGIATNLLNMHFTVLGYDVSLPSSARFVEAGSLAGTSPADVSKDEDILLLLPANAAQATSVLYGDEESVAALSVGALIILLSTASTAFVAQMELRLQENIKDFNLVGTSVSGRVEDAAAEVVAADGNEVLATTMRGGCLFIVLRVFIVYKISDVAGLDWFSVFTALSHVFSHLAGRAITRMTLLPPVLPASFQLYAFHICVRRLSFPTSAACTPKPYAAFTIPDQFFTAELWWAQCLEFEVTSRTR